MNLEDLLRGTLEGEELQDKLYLFCRNYGDYFNLENIVKLVFRDGGTFSMTGLTALSILYDSYPSQVKSLKLPEYIKVNLDMENYGGIYYYCRLRESYIDQISNDFDILDFNPPLEIEGFILNEYFLRNFILTILIGEQALLSSALKRFK